MTELTTPGRAFGRQLSDLWLDGEEGKLHPAEWKLLECARLGEECRLGSTRPTNREPRNLIRSAFIRFLVLGGNADHQIDEKGIIVSGAYVHCAQGWFDLEGTSLLVPLSMVDCNLDGSINLQDVSAKTLNFEGSLVKSIAGDRLRTQGSLFLRKGFESAGVVRLHNAKIGGNLEGTGGRFAGLKLSLLCEQVEVQGSVLLNDGFIANGPVTFNGANVSGGFFCRSGVFLGKSPSLQLEGAFIDGDVRCDQGFLAKGLIAFHDIQLTGSIYLTDGTFSSKSQSILAPQATIGSNVNLGTDCRVAGEISFQGAKIGGDITFQGGSFETKGIINLRNATIDGMLVWRDVAHVRGELNLSGTSCRTLNMDWKSWAKPSQIRLDNFTYLGFSELPEGCNAAFWTDWLERQPERHLEKRFRPNPYKQLANVLSDMGHEEESRSIRIAQRRRQADFVRKYDPELNRDKRWVKRALLVFWNFVQRVVVAYGYRPGNALLYLAGLVAVGSVIYHAAARDGIMTPTHPLIFKEAPDGFIPERCAENWVYLPKAIAGKCAAAIPSEYSEFNAIVYSLDTAIPVVDFRMESDWAPRVVTTEGKRYWPGWWVRTWEWFQIGTGWALSLLFVSAIGGVIRRD